jgi:hypothetical protein
MLQHVLESVPVKDFQEWPPWRALVVATATQVLDYVGGVLIVPQSVLVEHYWMEIRAGLAKAGIPIHHFVLHAERDILAQQIEADTIDTGARQWRLDHLDAYEDAGPWLSREAKVVDTTHILPTRVAQLVAAAVG